MKDTQTYREDEGNPADQYGNGQVKQAAGQDLSPADGGEGFVGSITGPAVNYKMVTGKSGYSQDMPIWEEKSSFTDTKDGSGSTGNTFDKPGTDSTDEKASYKKIQTDEGLPQTYRTSDGAGDAGPSDSDEPDERGSFGSIGDGGGKPNTQSVPGTDSGDHDMSMPQTEFTNIEGGGAPKFKFSGQ